MKHFLILILALVFAAQGVARYIEIVFSEENRLKYKKTGK